ncbi:MAG: hypothetical protein IJ794_00505 [Lachnospiraceae bacterium]|nr:hypothetical protein [Lachnospiraceae bacterium]MBR1851645.1 hypothetical protein [Lachnospiraceae bacterium]
MLKEVREVFTKEFRDEVEYREFMQKKLYSFKLNNQSEAVEDIIKRLQDKNFQSNFMPVSGEWK